MNPLMDTENVTLTTYNQNLLDRPFLIFSQFSVVGKLPSRCSAADGDSSLVDVAGSQRPISGLQCAASDAQGRGRHSGLTQLLQPGKKICLPVILEVNLVICMSLFSSLAVPAQPLIGKAKRSLPVLRQIDKTDTLNKSLKIKRPFS